MKTRLLGLVIGLLLGAPVVAQDNDFLTDYSLLEKRDGTIFEAAYVAPGARERLEDYNAVMVDQPEIFIAPDSKYKGAKPDQLKALADTSRGAMVERLEAGGYTVTETPGDGVILIKQGEKRIWRGEVPYTPVGFVVHSTRQAAIKDLWKKIDIIEMGLEMELTDSQSGEIFAAMVSQQGHRETDDVEQDPVTWEELDAMFLTIGERMRCAMDNARIAEDARADCSAILIEPVYEDEEDD